FSQALAAGVLPFIPGDLAKIALAAVTGPMLRDRLEKINLLPAVR
ncbi:MAG: biotin transporter BioY, partial [Oscillospiraceae bacterium]